MISNPQVDNFLKKKKSPIYNKLIGKIKYLNYEWAGYEVPKSIDDDNKTFVKEIIDFIDSSINHFKGVMIISATN